MAHRRINSGVSYRRDSRTSTAEDRTSACSDITADSDVMPYQKRRAVRPLGSVNSDSRLEIQVEKALFRTNIKLLSDMISVKRMSYNPVQSHSMTAPYGRMPNFQQVLSFTDKDRLMNNATHAKYYNAISQRVGSSDIRRKGRQLTDNSAVCSRRYDNSNFCKRMKTAHCDVLGPDFCTDCSRLKRRIKSAQHHTQNFPSIDVHSKSLVAPRKLESLLLSRENELISARNHSLSTVYYDLANIYSGTKDTQVFTENEIYDRVRSAKRQENNKEIQVHPDRDLDLETLAPPCSRENSDLQDMPMPNNMRVTVSFSV